MYIISNIFIYCGIYLSASPPLSYFFPFQFFYLLLWLKPFLWVFCSCDRKIKDLDSYLMGYSCDLEKRCIIIFEIKIKCTVFLISQNKTSLHPSEEWHGCHSKKKVHRLCNFFQEYIFSYHN